MGQRFAKAVSSFYEQHPYPPPEKDLDAYRDRWRSPDRRRAEFHLLWPFDSFRENRSILVAGCGTSQAAKFAMRWPEASVTGIDISETSLKHAQSLKRKYSLDNLELRWLAVEDAPELGRCFDQVVCTGVLHHLRDPDLGLRALGEVAEPGGVLYLMVYAPYGRAGVYLLQEYCRRLNIGTSESEIHDLAQSLRSLPPDHPIIPLLRDSPDFQSEAGLADALLHPQDRAYSVPELLEYIDREGLKLGRWLRQAPYLPYCGSVLSSPHQSLLARLPASEQYSALELFRGTMLRHSLLAYRKADSSAPQRIHFEGDGFLTYVPIRVPGTICVEERLPSGVAGVLINRAHTFRDIYLPIDAEQKQPYRAIDGVRSIGEIVSSCEVSPEDARVLFQRLWWYDQVVFDASAGSVSAVHSDQ